jgi:anti-sigma regulatory factor (Ser/Thr protein kinase)
LDAARWGINVVVSASVPGQETTVVVERKFPPDPGQVRAARHFALGVVGRWGLDPEGVGLVVSELATNAVLHGRSPFTLSLKREGRRVVITVADDNSTLPMVLPVASAYALNGRGLGIVARLSVDWGVRTRPGGKVVWAQVDCCGNQSATQPEGRMHQTTTGVT